MLSTGIFQGVSLDYSIGEISVAYAVWAVDLVGCYFSMLRL